jgi:mono/diheme cytochrome c family protein
MALGVLMGWWHQYPLLSSFKIRVISIVAANRRRIMPNQKLSIKTTVTLFTILAFIFPGSKVLAHKWAAPKAAAERQNPVSFSQASVAAGQAIYSKKCTRCHGTNAEGLSPKVTGLKKWTSNLVLGLQNHSDGDFFWKIQNGRGAMPSFGKELSENEIWDVINFVKSIPRKKD